MGKNSWKKFTGWTLIEPITSVLGMRTLSGLSLVSTKSSCLTGAKKRTPWLSLHIHNDDLMTSIRFSVCAWNYIYATFRKIALKLRIAVSPTVWMSLSFPIQRTDPCRKTGLNNRRQGTFSVHPSSSSVVYLGYQNRGASFEHCVRGYIPWLVLSTHPKTTLFCSYTGSISDAELISYITRVA